MKKLLVCSVLALFGSSVYAAYDVQGYQTCLGKTPQEIQTSCDTQAKMTANTAKCTKLAKTANDCACKHMGQCAKIATPAKK